MVVVMGMMGKTGAVGMGAEIGMGLVVRMGWDGDMTEVVAGGDNRRWL